MVKVCFYKNNFNKISRRVSMLVLFVIIFCLSFHLARACGYSIPPVKLLSMQQDLVDTMEKQRQIELEQIRSGAMSWGAGSLGTISMIEKYYSERDTLATMKVCGEGWNKGQENKLLQARIDIASQLLQEVSACLTFAKDRRAAGTATEFDVTGYEIAVLRAKLKLETLKLQAR
jgi:hypothetical protein